MNRTFVSLLFAAALCCLFSVSPCNAAGTGEVKFGTGVTGDWKLINEAREFDTNLITVGFYGTKPYGVMQVVVSIYHREKSGASESLLSRVKLDVNPQWGIMVIPDLPLPGVGHYTFNMSTVGGEALAVGSVTITEKKVEAKMPEQPKIDGTTLEDLFNKYKPKS